VVFSRCEELSLRIAYISLATPTRRESWSGTPWYSFREIRRRYDDVHLLDTPWIDAIVESMSALQRYGLSVRQRRFLARYYSRALAKQLGSIKPDVILSVGASHKIQYFEQRCPIIHVSDGLFGTMVAYYSKFRHFRPDVMRDAHADHQQLLNKTSMVLFASEWARDSALEFYDYPLCRTRVVPFGANLDEDPGYSERRTEGPLILLFVGYDWERKGGDLAFEIWSELRRRTGDAEFHIVGCNPPQAANVEGVTVHGRLRKTKESDRRQLDELYRRASLFLMPSRQEAYGMVFCEASAYGLPSIATATGGVPTCVRDNETGLLLPPASGADAFADRILALWNDKLRYRAFGRAARTRYETDLNWRAWGDGVDAAIRVVTNGDPSADLLTAINKNGMATD
jgi:glycosyltransferase involved in cell wall biosynthesis